MVNENLKLRHPESDALRTIVLYCGSANHEAGNSWSKSRPHSTMNRSMSSAITSRGSESSRCDVTPIAVRVYESLGS